MFNFLLAEEAATDTAQKATGSGNQWIMWVIIGVVLVLMVVMTIIPQRKRRKEQENMMNSLVVGTKLMTVGGMVGRIQQVNADGTLIINVGTETNPTLIVIDKKAVSYVLEKVAAPVVEQPVEQPAEQPATENEAVESEQAEVADDAFEPQEEVVEEVVDEDADAVDGNVEE